MAHKVTDTEHSHLVVDNKHTNQGSQCRSVPTYALVVHNVALYFISSDSDGAQYDVVSLFVGSLTAES